MAAKTRPRVGSQTRDAGATRPLEGEAKTGALEDSRRPPLEPTSRICVKNLPKHADENRLKEHFSQKGEVTDVKVMRTREGRSRCFGFVGFASAESAAAAVSYFNKTFMDASRLEIEFAFKYGASERPLAWSKYTEGTSAHRRQVKAATGANNVPVGTGGKTGKEGAKVKIERKPEEEDPKLREFMAVMQPRYKQKIWDNDELAARDLNLQAGQPSGTTPQQRILLEDGEGSDDDLYEEIPGEQARKDEEDDDDAAEQGEDAGPVDDDAVVKNAAVSDREYLRSRMRKDFEDDDQYEPEATDTDSPSGLDDPDAIVEPYSEVNAVEEEEEGVEEEASDDIEAIFHGNKSGTNGMENSRRGRESPGAGCATTRQADRESLILETGRLFVRNLPYTATEEDIRKAFEKYGEVAETHIVLDKATRRSKGFGLVRFMRAQDAVSAAASLDGSIFMGRLLHVLPGEKPPQAIAAEEGTTNGSGAGGGSTNNYKLDKEVMLKASAGNKIAWNSLFMRSDTVADAVAAYYGVSKAELLDPQAPDMAVRLALGETQIIAQTKSALEEEGVNVVALEAAAQGPGSSSKVPRSDRVLLVKNLPYSADAKELEAMFSASGQVVRFVMPSTRTLALIEFGEPQDARRAFKSLAYKRYQSVPIYLEWAPADIFSSKPKAKTSKNGNAEDGFSAKSRDSEQGQAIITRAVDVAVELATAGDGDSADATDSRTIYVKNLSFRTDDAALQRHFAEAVEAAKGRIRSVRVARRKGKDGNMLSAGFGFVECSSESVAKDVVQALQGSMLDGHRLVLQLSQAHGTAERGSAGPARVASASKTALGPPDKRAMKIVVRNVAFEATRKDILGLFTPFGAVKSCRLPRKFDGSHRGFAFVEFATPHEARTAVEGAAGTHLYGRRLVIEWAEEDGGLDELRAKTAAKFAAGETGAAALGDDAENDHGVGGDGDRKRCAGAPEEARKKRRR